MNDHLWGPSVHVDKSFTKSRQGSDPPPSRHCLDFGNIWNGNTSLTCLLGTPDNAIGMGQFVIADMGYCIYLSFSSSLVARRLKVWKYESALGWDLLPFRLLKLFHPSNIASLFSNQTLLHSTMGVAICFFLALWVQKRGISSDFLSLSFCLWFPEKILRCSFSFWNAKCKAVLPTEQIQAFLSLFFSISMLKIL